MNTSEVAHTIEQAGRLRQRLLDGHDADIAALVDEAAIVFGRACMAPHMRWLALEREGYRAADARALGERFGVGPEDPLVVYVESYRVQRGAGADGVVPHFFVEPVGRLVEARRVARAVALGAASSTMRVAEAPTVRVTRDRRTARFDPSVFNLILLGLRATLYLQLATVEAAAWTSRQKPSTHLYGRDRGVSGSQAS